VVVPPLLLGAVVPHDVMSKELGITVDFLNPFTVRQTQTPDEFEFFSIGVPLTLRLNLLRFLRARRAIKQEEMPSSFDFLFPCGIASEETISILPILTPVLSRSDTQLPPCLSGPLRAAS
jgi:hypothetical protein